MSWRSARMSGLAVLVATFGCTHLAETGLALHGFDAIRTATTAGAAGEASAPCNSFHPYGDGPEYRVGKGTTTYFAVREAQRCELIALDRNAGAYAIRVEDLSATATSTTRMVIHFESRNPGLKIYSERSRRTYLSSFGSRATKPIFRRASLYRELCEAPCSVEVPLGERYFAVAVDGDSLTEIRQSFVVDAPMTVEVEARNRRGLRLVGGITAVGGVLAAMTGGVWFGVNEGRDASIVAPAVTISGGVLVAITYMLMYHAGLINDAVEVRTHPLNAIGRP